MNKEKLITVATLPIMWIAYFLFEFISGNITTKFDIFMNILFVLLLIFFGYILYINANKFRNGFKTKTLWIIFSTFMVLDQGSKLIIHLFFFEKNFDIIPNFLSFHPIINTKGSWLNVRFGTSLDFPMLITLNIIAIFLFIEFYRYYTQKGNKSFWSDLCFLTISAGCICSLIDKIFYGGSLDFIGISTLFIADIKDIYINIAIFAFILTAYLSGFLTSEDNSTIKDDIKAIKNFCIFVLQDLKIKK
ncbi:MAG: signal peptidase II [Sarcina sp.]